MDIYITLSVRSEAERITFEYLVTGATYMDKHDAFVLQIIHTYIYAPAPLSQKNVFVVLIIIRYKYNSR